jgi:hypothetical protein
MWRRKACLKLIETRGFGSGFFYVRQAMALVACLHLRGTREFLFEDDKVWASSTN